MSVSMLPFRPCGTRNNIRFITDRRFRSVMLHYGTRNNFRFRSVMRCRCHCHWTHHQQVLGTNSIYKCFFARDCLLLFTNLLFLFWWTPTSLLEDEPQACYSHKQHLQVFVYRGCLFVFLQTCSLCFDEICYLIEHPCTKKHVIETNTVFIAWAMCWRKAYFLAITAYAI